MTQDLQHKKVVLVIEDDPIFIRFLKELFEKRGIAVHIAGDGEVAYDMIKTEKPDFVVLDIRLPKRDGFEVLRMMRKETTIKETPVVVFTNFDLPKYQETAKELGVLDFLVKSEQNPKSVVERIAAFFETGAWK